jgi:hypothetical protein
MQPEHNTAATGGKLKTLVSEMLFSCPFLSDHSESFPTMSSTPPSRCICTKCPTNSVWFNANEFFDFIRIGISVENKPLHDHCHEKYIDQPVDAVMRKLKRWGVPARIANVAAGGFSSLLEGEGWVPLQA